MTVYGALFYLLALIIVVSTGLAITRRQLVHAVVYLIVSFVGAALLFYLLGAPFLAAVQVIIYAGAILVLFLFIVMMLGPEKPKPQHAPWSQWLPAAGFGAAYLAVTVALVFTDPDATLPLNAAAARPGAFGAYVFQRHWLAIEIVSLLLLVALVGALCLGKRSDGARETQTEGKP